MIIESSSLWQLLKTFYDGFPKGKVFPLGFPGACSTTPLSVICSPPWLAGPLANVHRCFLPSSLGVQHNFLLTMWQSSDDVPLRDVFFCAFPDYLFSKSHIEHLLFTRHSSRHWDYTTLKNAKSLPSWSLFEWEKTEN